MTTKPTRAGVKAAERTKREVTVTAHDLYATLLRWQANRVSLEKARERKVKKQEQRARARIARAGRPDFIHRLRTFF